MLKNFSLTRGDSAAYTLTFTNSNGTVIDISAWTILFTLKTSYDLPDTQATLQKKVGPGQHSDPTHGITILSFAPGDTALLPSRVYDYDIVILPNATDAYTILKGKFDLQYDVSWSHTTAGTAGTEATTP